MNLIIEIEHSMMKNPLIIAAYFVLTSIQMNYKIVSKMFSLSILKYFIA